MKHRTTGVHTLTNASRVAPLLFLLVSARCVGAAWEGVDDFSSGISSSKWLSFQNWYGQMTVIGANGHASFLVPVSTTTHQNAKLIWKGQPAVTNDWIVEIAGHNSADYSGSGSSQFEFICYDTGTLQTSPRGYGFTMSRGLHGNPTPQVTVVIAPGIAQRYIAPAPNPDFAMRLVYSAGAGTLEAWWDETGNGSSWTQLDTVSLETALPGMGSVATNSFTFIVEPDAYFGPIVEGQIWADNFLLAAAPPPPPPQLVVADAQWSAGYQRLQLIWTNNGSSSVLESTGLLTGDWSPVTSSWTTNSGWISTTVSNTSPVQFYRLRAVGPGNL